MGKGTMVIGYDTYHDSAQKGRSAGALVASLNKTFTKYLSVANLHTNPAQELDDNICPAIARALRKYNDLNGEMPQRIILYRDGVGDGQINYVLEHEIKAIEKCFQAAGINQSELKFTYIIVSKRINTRFFRMNGKPSNPPSGTVVDSDVTLPERYDFFLVSQSVNQGTVNPTSYNVVKDTSGLLPKHIQALTYKLAHLYYNWPGTVRVPSQGAFPRASGDFVLPVKFLSLLHTAQPIVHNKIIASLLMLIMINTLCHVGGGVYFAQSCESLAQLKIALYVLCTHLLSVIITGAIGVLV